MFPRQQPVKRGQPLFNVLMLCLKTLDTFGILSKTSLLTWYISTYAEQTFAILAQLVVEVTR